MSITNALLGFYLPLLVGFIYGKIYKGKELSQGLSKIVLYFFLPLLLYDSISSKPIELSLNEYWYMSILAVYTVIVSLIPAYIFFKDNKELIMVSAYTNAGYFPIPIAYALWGKDAISLIGFYILGQVIVVDFMIPFLASSSFREGFQKLIKFPPIYALLLGIFSSYFALYPPKDTLSLISNLGGMAPTLALIVLGIESSKLKEVRKADIKVTFIRQLYSPLTVFPVLIFLGFSRLAYLVAVLESMMPPAVANVIFANEFNLNVKNITNAVLTSTLIATIVVPPLFFFGII